VSASTIENNLLNRIQWASPDCDVMNAHAKTKAENYQFDMVQYQR